MNSARKSLKIILFQQENICIYVRLEKLNGLLVCILWIKDIPLYMYIPIYIVYSKVGFCIQGK